MSSDSGNAEVAKLAMIDAELEKRRGRLADRVLFLRKFLDKGRQISSAVPSSKSMVRGVLRHVDFSRPSTIIELGAGTGPLTEGILDRIGPEHRFVAVENDPDFCEVLHRRFPGTSILRADATRIAAPLVGLGIKKVDYVLSCLPTPSMPRRSVMRLIGWLRENLSPNGLFIQITIVPLLYRGFYDRLFESVNYDMVWLNAPPGGVFWCARPRLPGTWRNGAKTKSRLNS